MALVKKPPLIRGPLPRLQGLRGGSLARQRPGWPGPWGPGRLALRPPERGAGGRTRPTTGRRTAGRVWATHGMIAQAGLPMGGLLSVLLEWVPPEGAARRFVGQHERLRCWL